MKIYKKIVRFILIFLAFISIFAISTTANASTRIPRSFRGTWEAKPTYTWQTKHINKNIAVPRTKMTVYSKSVYWKFTGYLPKQPGLKYDHKTRKLTLSKYSKHVATLKGHGPYRNNNLLTKDGSKLRLEFLGGVIVFSKAK